MPMLQNMPQNMKVFEMICNQQLSFSKVKTIALTGLGLLMLITLPNASSATTAAKRSSPNASERAELNKHPTFTKNIHVIDKNEGNNVHRFLESNIGKTVFFDTAILVYTPINPNLTQEQKDLAPTDRFQNKVMNKCWIDQGGIASYTDFGEKGFPLPLNDADINAGCKTRIRLALTDGDASPDIIIFRGDNKAEIVLSSFFEVAKKSLDGAKTLYILTQKTMPEETADIFVKFKRNKNRDVRKLSLDQ